MLIQKLSVKHSTSALLMVQEVSPSTVSSVPMELCSISNILCVTGGSMWTVLLLNSSSLSMTRLLLRELPTLLLKELLDSNPQLQDLTLVLGDKLDRSVEEEEVGGEEGARLLLLLPEDPTPLLTLPHLTLDMVLQQTLEDLWVDMAEEEEMQEVLILTLLLMTLLIVWMRKRSTKPR